jgi:hypothetical protein
MARLDEKGKEKEVLDRVWLQPGGNDAVPVEV